MSSAEEVKVNIRPMTHSDIHEVLALDRSTGRTRRNFISYEAIAAANPGGPHDMSFVAEVGGKLVGYMMSRLEYLMVPFTQVCVINAILVHPNYQKHGVGGKLVERLLNHCQAEGINTVRAIIPEGNEELQHFFERNSFQRSRIINFDKTFES